MKNKRTFFSFLVFTLSVLLLWNCESEEVNEITQTSLEHVNVTRHIVSLEHLEEHNENAYQILSKLSKSSMNNRTEETDETYSEEYDLFLDLSKIYVIESEDYKQFSFVVRSPNQIEGQFENYMLVEYQDGGYNQFVLTYEYENIDNGSYNYIGIRELEGNQLYTRSISSCDNLPQLTPVEVTVCTFTNCTGRTSSGGWANHSFGDESCRCGISLVCSPPIRDCTTETQWIMTCPDGGTSDGNPNDPNNGQTGGGNGSETNDEDGIPVIPIEEDYAEDIINCIDGETITGGNTNVLNQAQRDWINNAPASILMELRNYLTINGCYENIQQEVIEVINIFMNASSGSRVVIDGSLDEYMEIETADELFTFIDDLKSTIELEEFTVEDSLNSIEDTKVTKFKVGFASAPIVKFNFHVTSKLDDPNTQESEFELKSLDSFLSQVTVFLKWTQDSYEHSVSGDVVTVNVNGHLDIGVKVGGIPLAYTENYSFELTYNKVTGDAIDINLND